MSTRLDADEQGVDSRMRLFVEELATSGSWKDSCDVAGVNDRTPRRWLESHPGFQALFQETFGSVDLSSYKKQASILQSKAMRVYDESMDAAQIIDVKVQCPNCGERFTSEYTVPNQGTRLKAADSVSKITTMLKETKDVKHGGAIALVQLTGAEKMALIALQSGLPISPQLRARLVELQVIEPDDRPALPPPREPYTDAEFKEVP